MTDRSTGGMDDDAPIRSDAAGWSVGVSWRRRRLIDAVSDDVTHRWTMSVARGAGSGCFRVRHFWILLRLSIALVAVAIPRARDDQSGLG